MSSTSNGALGTATNLFSGDASAALGNNLIHGKGLSISDSDSPIQAFLAPGMHQLGIIGGSSGGGSSSGSAGGLPAQAPQSSGATASGPSQSGVMSAANNGALSTLSNGSQPTAPNGYVQPSSNVVGTGLNATGSTNTGVGSSQLGDSRISSSGTPMTMYQMLLQSGRATSGY